ncbi:hypothetical protein ACH5RR_022453 [Cinchona calisaya]|uniref:Protein kinase domain-containing protein n=1 Tax=Cinchona calisaya TaxID=153742 RepID=A0ABD2Z7U1_9GENT
MASPLNCRTRFPKLLEHFLLLYLLLLCKNVVADDDQNDFHGEERDALLALVSGFNNSFLRHNWTSIMCYKNDPPYWFGIECWNGRVTSVRLENLGLTGEIKIDALFNLTELSVLSFKDNSISGQVMDFSNNQKLTDIDLSGNKFDGPIPLSLLKLNSLASLQLQANNLSGSIPWFDQTSLKEFNVSYNNLSRPIPNTKVLQSFNRFSFLGNPNLCGPPTSSNCNSTNDTSDTNNDNNKSKGSSKSSIFVPILLAVNVVVLIFLLFLSIIYFKKYKGLKKKLEEKHIVVEDEEKHDRMRIETGEKGVAAEGEEKGKLVFINEERQFELDDLLKASAEGLGKGNFGNCYKAMLESGPIVVVKRLRDLKPLSSEDFTKQVRIIAEQKHLNLLSLLAYYYSKDEKLLLYKFASNGNIYNRLHEGKGKPTRIPFRWSSRLLVARGVAKALEYLHQTTKSSPNVVPHGNLKLSNVLLDENNNVLVTDYGLTSLIAAPLVAQRMISFKSPEYQSHKKLSRKSDIWSYGCLLLELVTGRVSADSGPSGTNAVDLCSWVHRAVREEWTAEIFDVEIAVQRSANHGMLKLLQIAMRCCERSPENRPEISEVVREVESIDLTPDSEDDEEFSSMDRSLTDESMSATPSRSTIGEDQP